MNNHGIDTPFFDDFANKTDNLKALGIKVVMGYLFHGNSFKQIVNEASSKKFTAAGIGLEVVWESGAPINVAYFQQRDGTVEGNLCVAAAKTAGVPVGSIIFAAVDFDCSSANFSFVKKYFAGDPTIPNSGFRAALLKAGYKVGVYGNGLVCSKLTALGLVSGTMLSGSTGWQGYKTWKPNCTILQTTLDTKILNIVCDKFETNLSGFTV